MLFFNHDDDKGIQKTKDDINHIKMANVDFYKSMNNIKFLSKKFNDSYNVVQKSVTDKKSKKT
jgi:hypothetical protein